MPLPNAIWRRLAGVIPNQKSNLFGPHPKLRFLSSIPNTTGRTPEKASPIALLCLAVDHENNRLSNKFILHEQPNVYISDICEKIKATKMPHLLGRHVDVPELRLWKLLKPLPVGCNGVGEDVFNAAIKWIVFPSPNLGDATKEDGFVQLLEPEEQVANHWKCDPEKGRLHLIVQVPCTLPSPSGCPTCLMIVQLSKGRGRTPNWKAKLH
jgi:hypothetical protein